MAAFLKPDNGNQLSLLIPSQVGRSVGLGTWPPPNRIFLGLAASVRMQYVISRATYIHQACAGVRSMHATRRGCRDRLSKNRIDERAQLPVSGQVRAYGVWSASAEFRIVSSSKIVPWP